MKNPSLAKMEFNNFGLRLGKIFFNLAIFLLIFCVCGMVSLLSTAFLFLVGAVVTILSMGTIFVYAPNFWNSIVAGMNATANFFSFVIGNAYIFLSIVIALSIASIVILALDRQNKHTSRIVVASIVLVVALLMMIFVATGVIA